MLLQKSAGHGKDWKLEKGQGHLMEVVLQASLDELDH